MNSNLIFIDIITYESIIPLIVKNPEANPRINIIDIKIIAIIFL